MTIVVIINKNAGSVSGADNEYSPENITKIFQELNVHAEVHKVEGERLSEMANLSAKSGVDAVIAAGGDGTVNCIASALVDSDIPLGVLPSGTLNHFAKDLGIPLSIVEAAKVISEKKVVKVDVGEVNGRFFLNNSSIGFYPQMVKHRDKNGFWDNKWLAMVTAMFNVLSRYPVLHVKIKVNNESLKSKIPFVFVGNNEYKFDILGPGLREKLDEGQLSLYYPDTTGRLSMIKFTFFALMNKLNQTGDFNFDQTEEIILEFKKKNIEISIDGEVVRLDTPLHYHIKPLSLNVICSGNSS